MNDEQTTATHGWSLTDANFGAIRKTVDDTRDAVSARNFVSKGDRSRATRFGIVINVEDKEGLERDTTIASRQQIETGGSAAANTPKGKTLEYWGI